MGIRVMWAVVVILAGFVVVAVVLALHSAYAAGWNASARYHRNRPRIAGAENPFWREYR